MISDLLTSSIIRYFTASGRSLSQRTSLELTTAFGLLDLQEENYQSQADKSAAVDAFLAQGRASGIAVLEPPVFSASCFLHLKTLFRRQCLLDRQAFFADLELLGFEIAHLKRGVELVLSLFYRNMRPIWPNLTRYSSPFGSYLRVSA